MKKIASLEAELSKLRTQIASYALRQEEVELQQPDQQGTHCHCAAHHQDTIAKCPLVGALMSSP